MRFKMYKSGKNWMVAGLMTTAVLAGLTLSNVNNDVVAHAATEPAVASTCPTPGAVSNAKNAADQANAAVKNQEGVVSNAQSAANSAASVNEGLQQLSSAQNSASQAQNDYWNIHDNVWTKDSAAYSDALASQTSASNAQSAASQAAEAQNVKANIPYLEGQIKTWQDQLDQANSAQAKVDSASAQSAANYKAFIDATNAAADYRAKQNLVEPGFKYDPVHQQNLDNEALQLQHLADASNAALQQAQRALNELVNNKFHFGSIADMEFNLKNKKQELANYEATQKKLDDANTALDNAKKAASDLHDKLVQDNADMDAATTKYNDAIAEIANIRKTYNLWTDQQMADAKSNQQQIKNSLDAATRQANGNANWKRAHDLKDAIATAKSNAAKAEADMKAADDAAPSLNSAVSAAQAKVDQLQSQYDQALANNAKPEEQQAIARKLGDANTVLQNAQKAVRDNTSKYQTAVADSNTWNNSVTSWTNEMNTLLADLDVQAAQALIDHYQSQLDEITSQINSAEANKDAVNNLAKAQKALSDAQAKLSQLQKDAANKQATYEALQKALDDCKNDNKPGDNTNPGNTNKPGDAVKPGNGSAVNGGNASVNGSNTEVANASTISASAVSVNSNKTANQNAKLAQTGNSDSAAVVALGALSAMLGLGMVAKKREF